MRPTFLSFANLRKSVSRCGAAVSGKPSFFNASSPSAWYCYWDCCAEIRREGDSLRLQLWDEDISKYIGLSSARIREEDGMLQCTVGAFLDREIGPDDWHITRTQDDCGVLLHIEGNYEAVGKGGFQYEIFLRPWGSRWPGSEDEKPYHYEDWYLLLIDAGVKMPDEIGKGT